MSGRQTPSRVGYDEAEAAILAGKAEARALWMIISDEHQRDNFALKPMPWEGRGEYQLVEYADGRSGFVRIPGTTGSLKSRPQQPTTKEKPTCKNSKQSKQHSKT